VVIPDVGTVWFGDYRMTGQWARSRRTKACWSRPMVASASCTATPAPICAPRALCWTASR